MSELGSGSGSSYPGALDTDNTLEVNSPNAGKTKARAEVPNDLAAAVIAIETELGVDPAGSLSDVKTFLQTEHAADGTHTTDVISEKTAATGVTVDGLLIKDGGISDGTNSIKTKIIEIGDWNMYGTGGGSGSYTKNVAHGLTYSKIRGISFVSIRNDADSLMLPLNFHVDPIETGGRYSWDATNVILAAGTASGFDSTDYNSTSYNRGWITITYVA